LPKADRTLAVASWVVLILRGVLPAAFAIAMAALVGPRQQCAKRAGGQTADGLQEVPALKSLRAEGCHGVSLLAEPLLSRVHSWVRMFCSMLYPA